MADKSLIDYIKQQLNQGFDINSIRNHLIQNGYSFKQVDDAIEHLYRNKEVKHIIHLSRSSTLVLIFLFVGISMVIAAIFIYLTPTEKMPGENKEYLLDLEVNPITASVEPGQMLEFSIELFNVGYKGRFDAHLTHTITDKDRGAALASLEEEIGVITRASKNSMIRIPADAKMGNYKLETVADYQQKTASASFVFSVFKEGAEACNDSIKNQDEEGIDCGGACSPCKPEKECPGSCDDSNNCTDDYCNETTGFECRNEIIELCCGNSICEPAEDTMLCPSDCMIEQPVKTFKDVMDEILETAKTDQQKAIQLCTDIEEEAGRDYCFNDIALATENDRLCSQISETIKRDSCIMNIAINTNNYSNCGQISNENLRNSCSLLAGEQGEE